MDIPLSRSHAPRGNAVCDAPRLEDYVTSLNSRSTAARKTSVTTRRVGQYLGAQASHLHADGTSALQAQAVLDAGRTLWQAYFAHTDVRTVRDELKLNRSDVGWYQIRNALKARNSSGDTAPVDFTPFEIAYKKLSDKLRPQVYELGFLR
jgi:hypothetical protein